MYKINGTFFVTAILILALFASACAQPAATPLPTSTLAATPTATPAQAPTPARTPTPPTVTPSPTPTTASPNAGQLADAGKNVYAKSCARCHGEKGEGVFAPALIGPNMRLGTFNNAKGLMDFISSAMPMDAPGSLSQQEYLQVLSFLLLQNGLAQPATIMNSNQLGQVQIKKISVESNDDNGRGRGRGSGRR